MAIQIIQPRHKVERTVFRKTDNEKSKLLTFKKEINKELFKTFGTKKPGKKQFTNSLKFQF